MDRLGDFEFGDAEADSADYEAPLLTDAELDPAPALQPSDPDEFVEQVQALLGRQVPEVWPSLAPSFGRHDPRAQLEDWDLMVGLAGAAAHARRDSTAAGLAAAMVPLALRLVPSLDRALWPALPCFVRGSMALTWELRRRGGDAARLALLPLVLRRCVMALAGALATGQQLPSDDRLLRMLHAEARRMQAVAPSARMTRNQPPGEPEVPPEVHTNGTQHDEAAPWP